MGTGPQQPVPLVYAATLPAASCLTPLKSSLAAVCLPRGFAVSNDLEILLQESTATLLEVPAVFPGLV